MSEVAERIYDDIVEEIQQDTGEVTGKEFNSQVKERTEEAKSQLQAALGEAAEECTAAIDQLQVAHSIQVRELVGDEYVGDTEEKDASGYVEVASKKMVLSKQGNTSRTVDDISYRRGVARHEHVHKHDQASSYNGSTVVYRSSSGEQKEANLTNLVEHHAIDRSGQRASDLTPDYVEHHRIGGEVEALVGTAAYNAAMLSGDIEALQRTIDAKQREKILEQLTTDGSLPNEQN